MVLYDIFNKIGFLEEQLSLALDVFIKDIHFFNEEDLRVKSFGYFIRELSSGIINFNNDITLYKTAKFLDWFNIKDPHIWYNLERAITSRKDQIKPDILAKILDHFANQNQGTGEFYDMYQYLFWCDYFDNVNNTELISLVYNMFLTTQGKS